MSRWRMGLRRWGEGWYGSVQVVCCRVLRLRGGRFEMLVEFVVKYDVYSLTHEDALMSL